MTETPVVPPPARGGDLELTETASTPTVHQGGQLIYTLVVRNRGPGEATRLTVSDPVPAGVFLQSVEPSQGSCAIRAAGLTCRLGAPRPGGEALVLVSATVAADARRMIVDAATSRRWGQDADS